MAMSLGVTVTSQVTSFSKEVTVTSPSDEQMARAIYNFAKMNLIFIYSMLQKTVTSYKMCKRKYILSIYNCALFAKNSATKLDFKLGRER